MDSFSSPHRLYRDSMGGGILLNVREDISSNLLSIETKPIEGFELNLWNEKWLINRSYNPHKIKIRNHLWALNEK